MFISSSFVVPWVYIPNTNIISRHHDSGDDAIGTGTVLLFEEEHRAVCAQTGGVFWFEALVSRRELRAKASETPDSERSGRRLKAMNPIPLG